MKKLGIISGSGDLPFLLAKSVADHGMEPIVVQVTQEMSPELGKIVNHIHPIGIGQIRKIIKLFLILVSMKLQSLEKLRRAFSSTRFN